MEHFIHKEILISGMTCVNCQNRIQKALLSQPGVYQATVSYKSGKAEFSYDPGETTLTKVYETIKKLDYRVVKNRKSQAPDQGTVICILLILISIYILFERFGVLNMLVPGQLADSDMGYGMLFVIGILTSVHCVAMCGGIQLSQCIGAKLPEAKQSAKQRVGPAVLYNLGRVISYTVVGFVLGFLGMILGGSTDGFGVSTILQGMLKLAAGTFMVIMGINMLGLFPALRKFQPAMPRFLTQIVGKEKTTQNGPFIVGLLNGLMPCGPLQSMQIVALASGSPLAGALSMFLFSLGTVPFMLGLGSIVTGLGKKFASQVMKIGAGFVVVLGLAMLSQGGSLSGFILGNQLMVLITGASILGIVSNMNSEKTKWKRVYMNMVTIFILLTFMAVPRISVTDAGTERDSYRIEDGIQIVESNLLPGKYPSIQVKKGIPVKWMIRAEEGTINGCNYKIIVRNLNMEHTFTTGENTIEFTPTESGVISYTCWMGMIRGSITVEE